MSPSVVAVTGGRVVPVSSDPIEGGTVLVVDGRITAVGADVPVPSGARVIDATGRWVLPGFVEAHGHVGLHEEGEGAAGNDTNEMVRPNTAAVRAIDGVNIDDEGFRDALVGGVTSVVVKPGSGNPIGGPVCRDEDVGRPGRRRAGDPGDGEREVGARREPQARLRRAQAAAVDPARHRAGDPRGVHGRAALPSCPRRGGGRGQAVRGRPDPRGARPGPGRRARTGTSTRTATTTSPPPCAWPTSSATSWSSTTAPRRTSSRTCSPSATCR